MPRVSNVYTIDPNSRSSVTDDMIYPQWQNIGTVGALLGFVLLSVPTFDVYNYIIKNRALIESLRYPVYMVKRTIIAFTIGR